MIILKIYVIISTGDIVDYKDKLILITGAYQGIGKSLSYYFAEKGANLIITYHNHLNETLNLKNELMSKFHINVDCIYLDLCQEDSIIDVYNYVKDKLIMLPYL